MSLTDFITGLPKAELHVHHVGSASPRIVAELAERHPAAGVPADPGGAGGLLRLPRLRALHRRLPRGRGLGPHPRGRADADLRGGPRDGGGAAPPVRRAHLHAVHLGAAGIPIEAYTEAIEDARVAAERDFGLVLRWIYDIPGESGLPAAEATLAYALDHAPDALVGFGLGGPEIGVPRPQFRDALRRRPGRRAEVGPARGGDHRSRDGVGRRPPARRRADRPRHLGGRRPGTPGAPRRGRHRAGGLPDVQHRHPGRRDARGAPAAHLSTPASR